MCRIVPDMISGTPLMLLKFALSLDGRQSKIIDRVFTKLFSGTCQTNGGGKLS
jgi:hypothetical protein